MLKQLWDYIFLVRTSIDEWKTTAWVDIDVENMDMECKKFAKDIRGLDKEMRGWNAFIGLELTVKNMLTSLRAVGELQNPAIRERHWEQLVQATRVQFIMSDDTRLSDLLSLNLHNFEDEVRQDFSSICLLILCLTIWETCFCVCSGAQHRGQGVQGDGDGEDAARS